MSEKKHFSHVIRENWCKGCGICVAYCPKKVLELKGGKVFAARWEDCIGCRMCELRCPDFAIEIHERDKENVVTRDSACVDYALPPEANNA
jgi:2-oxoglutarate ferredoxin oxidoreductase subunit delta